MESGRRRAFFTDFLTAFAGMLFLISFSVVAVLCTRQIYYQDIRILRLEDEVNLTEEQIRENYDALIDYNLLWKGRDELELPDFPVSEHGRIHFAEVKRIFAAVQYLALCSAVLFAAGLWGKLRRGSFRCLKWTAVLALVFPAVLGALIAANWDAFFVGFHHLMFSNDYWLFDPASDPVILILPDAFFLHCAAGILIFVVLGSVLAGLTYWFLRKNGRQKRTFPAD